jgi:hypothetical protein
MNSFERVTPRGVALLFAIIAAWLGGPSGGADGGSTTPAATALSPLEGFQMHPLSASVRVRGTVELKVRYCFDDSDDAELAPLIFACDPEQTDPELTPLIPSIPEGVPLTWRVNGIEGGNNAIGRVVPGGGPGARYIAPNRSPSPDTVTVSADWITKEKGKLLVAGSIEIVDAGDYVGTIGYEDPSAGVRLSGNVRWVAGEVSAKTLDGSATLKLQLSSLEENCSLVTSSVTAEGELSLNFPEDDRYHFGLTPDAATVSCSGIEIPIAVPWLLCTGWPENPPSMGNGTILRGSASCDGARMEWDFRRTVD